MYACQDPSSMRFVPLYHTPESCPKVRNEGFKERDYWPLQDLEARMLFESSNSPSPSRTMYACQDPSSMRFVPLYHTPESCPKVRNEGFKERDYWPLQDLEARMPFESSNSPSPSRTMYACQDPSSMRFVPLYHSTESCPKVRNEGFKERDYWPLQDLEARMPFESSNSPSPSRTMYACQDPSSMRFVPLYHTPESCPKVRNEGFKERDYWPLQDLKARMPFESSNSPSPSRTMYACQDPSSMRFVPLYHTPESCEKSGLSKTRDAVHYKGQSLTNPCTDESSMRFAPNYGAVRRPLLSWVSESSDEFVTTSHSSSYSSTFKSPSKLVKKNSLVVSNSTDSGVFNSPPYWRSSPGSPVTPPRTKHEEKMFILTRSELGLDDLRPFLKHEAAGEEVKKPPTSDLVSLKNLSISDGIESDERPLDDSSDERPSTSSAKRVWSRSPGPSKGRLLKTSYKVPPHSRDLKMERNARASATSLVGTSIWDGNYNAVDKCVINEQSKRPDLKRSCTLCKSNNEPKDLVRSHALRSWDPSLGIWKLTCPVLRKHICPRCGATGDDAHTYTYCPVTIKEVGYRPTSLMRKLVRSAHESSGRRRKPQVTPAARRS